MAKKEEKLPPKTTTVTLTTPWGYAHVSQIFRGKDFPTIVDVSERALEWLKKNGYKEKDIEVVGVKPSNWDEMYPPPPVVVEETVKEVAPEVLAEVKPVIEPVIEPVVEGLSIAVSEATIIVPVVEPTI